MEFKSEKDIQNYLFDMFMNQDEDNDNALAIDDVKFYQQTILTTDKGIVVYMEDGTEIYLTIQAYKWDGTRLN